MKGWTSNKAFTETLNLERGFKTPQAEREGIVLGLVGIATQMSSGSKLSWNF